MNRAKHLCCLITLVSALNQGAAQSNNEVSALSHKLERAPAGVPRILILLKLGQFYFEQQTYNKNSLDSAMWYFNQAADLSRRLKQDSLESKAKEYQGSVYLQKDDTIRGKAIFLNVIRSYRQTKNKAGEAETWTKMGNQITNDNAALTQSQIRWYENAHALYRQMNNSLMAIELEKRIAEAHFALGKPALAAKELKTVLAELKAVHYRRLYFTYFSLSRTYSALGDLNQQLFYSLAAVKGMEAMGESAIDLEIYDLLAFTYFSLGENDKSLVLYNKLMGLSLRQDNNRYYYSSLNFVTKLMISKNDASKALSLLKTKTFIRPARDGYDRFAINMNFGNCYQALGDYARAEDYFLRALHNFDDDYPTRPIPIAQHGNYYLKLSQFYIRFGQYKKADYYLRQLDTIPPGFIPPLKVSQIKLLKSKVDSAAGNYRSALKYSQEYHQITDSLFTLEKQKQLSELQVSYETAKKDKDLLLKSANIKVLKQKERADHIQNRITRMVFISILISLVLLLAFLYYRYHLKKENNRQLIISQQQTSLKNEALERALIENGWLIKEIHHRVKNNLQIIISLLNSQSAFLKDKAALDAVTESRHRILAMSLIHQKLYKTDNVSYVFMPEYISEMINYLNDSAPHNLKLLFRPQLDPIYLDVSRAIPVGLILNETITNAIKHAFTGEINCGEISIQLCQLANDQVKLVVSDNGRGLSESCKSEMNGSFGMRLIRGLASDLDGYFEIDGSAGTTVTTIFDNHEIKKKEGTPLPQ